MPSEYQKWLGRNEQPEEKRELTRKEKWKNWWYYHKWYVLAGCVAVLILASIGKDVIGNIRNEPDYQLAYVGESALPAETIQALEQALEEMGRDVNGNGKVQVRINQYVLGSSYDYTAQVQLMTDYDSTIFLLEDPADFQEKFGLLACTEENAQSPLWYAWTDCPVLTELELGDYVLEGVGEPIVLRNQELLSGLYVGRRSFGEEADSGDVPGAALWEKLSAGAKGCQ